MPNDDPKQTVDWGRAAANDGITPEAAAQQAFHEQIALRSNSEKLSLASDRRAPASLQGMQRTSWWARTVLWLRLMWHNAVLLIGFVIYERWGLPILFHDQTLGMDAGARSEISSLFDNWLQVVMSIEIKFHLTAIVIAALALRALHGSRLATR